MQNAEYAARIEAVKQRAHGRWTEILGALGLDERMLKRKPMPCPVCKDGVDRFQYTDKFGDGILQPAGHGRTHLLWTRHDLRAP